MIAVRKKQPEFGRGDFEWVDLQNSSIAAYRRMYHGNSILAIHNLQDSPQTISLERKKSAIAWTDLLTNKSFDSQELTILLLPYQFLWLRG
jgi:hypothetical protein